MIVDWSHSQETEIEKGIGKEGENSEEKRK